MTNQELNRDIKKMWKTTQDLPHTSLWFDGEMEKEYKRLYFADNKADVLTLKSLKIMMELNRKYRFIPFHVFYINFLPLIMLSMSHNG